MNRTFKKIKFDFRFIIILLAVLTVPMLLSGCTSSSPEDVAKKAAQAYVEGNASAYYSLLAPGYVDYIVGDHGWYKTPEAFQKGAIQDSIDDLRDTFLNRCGTNYSVTVSVVNVNPCEDPTTLRNVLKELIRDYNYEEGDIEAITQVEVKFRYTGNNTGGDLFKTYCCVKERGQWYIHRPDIYALS